MHKVQPQEIVIPATAAPGTPVRFLRWWRGREPGQVQTLDHGIADALVLRGIAAWVLPAPEPPRRKKP